MAQRVSIELVDDVDGSTADQQIEFGLDGITYALDLSVSNAAKLRGEFQPWITHARRVGGRHRAKAPGGKDQTRAIREWAQQQGLQVSDRGRISAEVREAYAKAQGK